VVAEQRTVDGAWQDLHGRFTMEFRGEAARPRTAIRREFSVPVAGPSAPLRIAVRGIGRVGIANVELTNGVLTLRPRGWPAGRVRTIGPKAPASGFPSLDLETDAGSLEPVFGPS
jgi:hypothetical protein